MRLLYFILYVILPYTLKIYYPKKKITNNPKKYLGRTIYVSNHSASFMDPLVIASRTRPIVFFMTRSDIFTPLMKPILWAAHMLPIYRQHDGVDTKEKNREVLQKCANVLKYGRNLLIFGEGFTDDVFVRRLKPLKKGAPRIGFETLESINWSKKIYIATVGINYGDPNVIGSEMIISNGPHICLNDYREEYLANPNRVVTQIMNQLEKDLQNQLTHVEEYDWAFFHEHVTRMKRIGIDPFDKDTSIPLLQRWENSKNFAKWINAQDLNDEDLIALKKDLNSYFSLLKKLRITDTVVYEEAENKQNTGLKWLKIILLLPLSVLGVIHNYLPYKLIKSFVEKSFKRRVFWGSVKMLLGVIAIGVWNIPLVILMHYFIIKPLCVGFENYAWAVSFAYYSIVPWFGVCAYYSRRWYENIQQHKKLKKQLSGLVERRKLLLERINRLSFFTTK